MNSGLASVNFGVQFELDYSANHVIASQYAVAQDVAFVQKALHQNDLGYLLRPKHSMR